MTVAPFYCCEELHKLTQWDPLQEIQSDDEHPHWKFNNYTDQRYWVMDESLSIYDEKLDRFVNKEPYIQPTLSEALVYNRSLPLSDLKDWFYHKRVFPAYDADYLASKLKNYDYTIVNLNSNTFSLASDSLDDPSAAILGRTLAETLCNFAIELVKQEGEI